jgi:hypothetical protein
MEGMEGIGVMVGTKDMGVIIVGIRMGIGGIDDVGIYGFIFSLKIPSFSLSCYTFLPL